MQLRNHLCRLLYKYYWIIHIDKHTKGCVLGSWLLVWNIKYRHCLTRRHWEKINKLYKQYSFLREVSYFVCLFVLVCWVNNWILPYSSGHTMLEAVCGCFMTCNGCLAGNSEVSFGVAVFSSRATNIHSVWVQCPGMLLGAKA